MLRFQSATLADRELQTAAERSRSGGNTAGYRSPAIGDQAGKPDNSLTMHRLVPEFILEQYAAERYRGSFDACTLFVDISGFTPIADAIMDHGQHGAEVLAEIIRDVFDPLVRSVFEQGGFVTNFAGDAFTAVFAVESRLPKEMKPALAAAWRMQQMMGSAALHETPYGSFTMSVKVGISMGEVSWGIITSLDGSRAAYYFQGPAIDGSADAQKSAGAGQVVIDADVYETVRSMVISEPAGDHFRVTSILGDIPDPRPFEQAADQPAVMSRFFPREALQTDVSGELRHVTSMFISLPTVQAVEQLQEFMHIIFDLQGLYGGLLNRLDFGDKGASLLLYWGAPVAHENDVARALNFILDLQGQTVVPVNAGITYGIAHGGYSGSSLAGEYTCHGRGTTLAARFMESSPRGEVWVDEQIAGKAEHLFEIEYEGRMPFKGFAADQEVFVLLERKETSTPFYKGLLVGRKAEQERLVAFLQPLDDGLNAGALVVLGEPGIGKSRLVDASFSSMELEGKDFAVFICQTDEIVRESLNPFRYWLRRYMGQSEQQSEVRNKRSFNRKLDQLVLKSRDNVLAVELDRTRSFLGALLNLRWPDSLYEQLDAQGRYENTIDALATLLKLESLQRPLIVLIEDAQWLDNDSKTFLKQLVGVTSQGYPLAMVATARPEGEPAVLGADVPFQQIVLERISPDDQASLAADQLGAPISPALLDLLVQRAEGNPFFTEQMLRYLQEQEYLVEGDDEWRLKPVPEAGLPTDVRAVLVARLDRLSQHVRDVVQTASVLGREFEIKLLAAMLGDDSELLDKVAEAERMAIWTALTELRYIFKHALLRDAAYSMQIRSRRQALHRLALEAMENLYGEDLQIHSGELAYHAERALQVSKACRYLEMAGGSAKEAYQNSTALDYYERALALTPEDDLASRFELLASREGLHGRIGARQDQLQDLDEMGDLAEELEDRSRQVKVLISRGWTHWWSADYENALSVARQASAMAEAAGESELAAQADQVGTWAMIQRGAYDEARRLAERSLASARRSGDQHLESNALHSLGFIYRIAGDYYAGLQAAEQALKINKNEGQLHRQGTSLGNLGVAHMTLGDYQAAYKYFRQGLAISKETGSKASLGSDSINLAWNAQALGQYQAAITYAEEGLAILRGLGQLEMIAEGLLWLGHARTGAGDLEEAFDAYRESLRLRRQLGQENLAMSTIAGMARAALAAKDEISAVAHVEEIVSYLKEGESLDGTWEPLRLYLTCISVLSASGDPRSDKMLETAHQKLQGWADRIPDAVMRQSYLDKVPWHREIAALYRARQARA